MRPLTLFRLGVYTSLGVLATVAAAVAVYTARGVLILALIALFLAGPSLDPAVRALSRWHIRRGLAILVVVLVVLGLVAAFLQSVIPAMAEQFQAMVRDFPHYVASLQALAQLLCRWRSRGCCAGHPSFCQFREPRPSHTWKKIWLPRRSNCRTLYSRNFQPLNRRPRVFDKSKAKVRAFTPRATFRH